MLVYAWHRRGLYSAPRTSFNDRPHKCREQHHVRQSLQALGLLHIHRTDELRLLYRLELKLNRCLLLACTPGAPSPPGTSSRPLCWLSEQNSRPSSLPAHTLPFASPRESYHDFPSRLRDRSRSHSNISIAHVICKVIAMPWVTPFDVNNLKPA